MDDAGTPPAESEFHIDLRFTVEVSETVRAAFLSAQRRWEAAIIGDLPDVNISSPGNCAGAELGGAIDDVVIFVDVGPIDGKGDILGSASPCALRNKQPSLPIGGLMRFDVADLEDFSQMGRLEEVVLHEMGHVLGFGSLWQAHSLLLDQSPGNDPRVDTAFAGEAALLAFDAAGGDAYSGAKVPVENIGGEGTANGHWRDSEFADELMTSFLSERHGVLSAITIASFADLGYEVDLSQAEPYSWPSQGFLSDVTSATASPLREVRLAVPIYLYDASGELVGAL
jgi:Leishmanolysin